jgi:mercuric ion binding protein
MKTKQLFAMVITMMVIGTTMSNAQLKKNNEKVVFDVNMHCGACQQKIEKNIAHERGLTALEVNLEKKTVALTYDTRRTNPKKLQSALVKLGFTATEAKACCSDSSKKCDNKPEKTGCCSTKSTSTETKSCDKGNSTNSGCCSEKKAA